MAYYLALNILEDSLSIVAAKVPVADQLELVAQSEFKFSLQGLLRSHQLESTPLPEDAQEASIEDFDRQAVISEIQGFLSQFAEPPDSASVILSSPRIFYQYLQLPFREPRKLDQVVPQQVQDTLPFDLFNCITDSLVTAEESPGSFKVLTAVALEQEVALVLEFLAEAGIDPKVITTASAAIGQSVFSLGEDIQLPCSVVSVGTRSITVACISQEGTFFGLRELPSGNQIQSQASDIFRTFVAFHSRDPEYFESTFGFSPRGGKDDSNIVEHVNSRQLNHEGASPIYVIDTNADLCRKLESFGLPVIGVSSLPWFVTKTTVDTLPAGGEEDAHSPQTSLVALAEAQSVELAWAMGALAEEMRGGWTSILSFNFRKGPYTFRPAFATVLQALKEEAFYLALAAVCFVVWCASLHISAKRDLAAIDIAMVKSVNRVFENEKVPPMREVVFVEDKLRDLETKLNNMGSLSSLSSSLSPLDTLRTLSELIAPSYDIDVDSFNVGYSLISFQGTAAQSSTIGALEPALAKNKQDFCNLDIDIKGKSGASKRQKFAVEIEMCE